jgi:hypothetical protein
VNYNLEYQGEEARGLASEALNYMFQAMCQISRGHVTREQVTGL